MSLNQSCHADLSVLLNKGKLHEFVPSKKMTTSQKNKWRGVRFSVYFAILYYIITGNSYAILLPVLVYFSTYYMKDNTDFFTTTTTTTRKKKKGKIDTKGCSCVAPTDCNPVMNELPPFTQEKEACDITDKDIKSTIDKLENKMPKFNKILNGDRSDIDFYSIPRQIDNNYQNFLYPLPKTCKEEIYSL